MPTSRIGIAREWKTELERRAPLTPDDVAQLVAKGVEVSFEPSPRRIFTDEAYVAAGALSVTSLADCDLLIGIKEMPIARLQPERPHLFFSHTIKAQQRNMPLLRAILDRRCTLLDYELVRDEQGRRLIFFGVQAGQAGAVNALWALGRRLAHFGFETPLTELRQVRDYASLDDARSAIGRVGAALKRTGAWPEALSPFVIGVTGTGNVSRGVFEILSLLDPIKVTPSALLSGRPRGGGGVWQVTFEHKHTLRRRDGGDYVRDEFRLHPERYENAFDPFVSRISLLITGHYWRPADPRLLTRAQLVNEFARAEMPKLLLVADITADVHGSMECTVATTDSDRPTYVYDPDTATTQLGFEGRGLLVLAVDILPTEIARESSMAFGRFLLPHIAAVASCDYSAPFADLALPDSFRRAIIAHRGELTPEHAWLSARLPQ